MAAVSSLSRLVIALEQVTASRHTHSWISAEGTLVFGEFPVPRASYDFASERLVSLEPITEQQPKATKRRESLIHLAKRSGGSRYEIETEDVIYTLGSATQALCWGLEYIENLAPGTLDKLAEQKGRSKRPVARSKSDLYDLPSQRKYAEQLATGHYVATNNKALESLRFVRRAATIAGLSKDRFSIRRLELG